VIPNTVEARESAIQNIKQRYSLLLKEGLSIKMLLTEHEAAAVLAVDVEWLRRRRKSGKPPEYYKIGDNQTGAVRYSIPDLAIFVHHRMCHSTSQPLPLT
jgi:hypothetical protein